MLIWGDRDPFGNPEVARQATTLFPNPQLEVVSAGHGPWLGEPNRTAQLITDFLSSSQDR